MSTNRRAGHTPPRSDPTRAARLQRDAAMERTRSVTKGVAFASVAAVAVAGVYLSQALPGHTATSGSSSGGAAGAATPSGTPSAGASDGSSAQYPSYPSAPASAPTPAYNQAPVVSSGSS